MLMSSWGNLLNNLEIFKKGLKYGPYFHGVNVSLVWFCGEGGIKEVLMNF
jgi:hypothetical protein